MYKVLDLFAGAGGLSWGFLESKRFQVVLAYENNPHARQTYETNHLGTVVKGDVRGVGNTGFEELKRDFGPIDVIIGGPPCQGFSNANRQRRRHINQNNQMVKWYVEYVEKLNPLAFVLENVSMLRSETHRFFLEQDDKDMVAELGIPLVPEELMLHVGPSPVDVDGILGDSERLARLILPKQALEFLRLLLKYADNPAKIKRLVSRASNSTKEYLVDIGKRAEAGRLAGMDTELRTQLKAFFSDESQFDNLLHVLHSYVSVQEMLLSAAELADNHILADYRIGENVTARVQSYSVIDYIQKKLGKNYAFQDRLLNAVDYGVPQRRQRYIAIGVQRHNHSTAGNKKFFPAATTDPSCQLTVWDAIADLAHIQPGTSVDAEPIKGYSAAVETRLTRILARSSVLYNHVATATRDTAKERFKALKQGQNFHDLDVGLRENTFSRPERTQRTIYLRLNYGIPSPTVLNVRKSMWIHPIEDRALSIREAARLQTFPDNFVFKGSKDAQYQQVGNAVPPLLAVEVAKHLANLLDAGNVAAGIGSIEETPAVCPTLSVQSKDIG